jgi:hypothetical protein
MYPTAAISQIIATIILCKHPSIIDLLYYYKLLWMNNHKLKIDYHFNGSLAEVPMSKAINSFLLIFPSPF